MITGVISSNLVDKPCPNDRVHTRMFVLINSYSLDNVLLGNQSEIPKTKKHLSALGGPPLKECCQTVIWFSQFFAKAPESLKNTF